MSGITYQSLRDRILTAIEAPRGTTPGMVDGIVIESQTVPFWKLFNRDPAGGGAGDDGDFGTSILDLRVTRLASGWGTLGGIAIGVMIGLPAGVPGLLAGALFGALLGSLIGIGLIVGLAAGAARLGATWTLVLAAAAVLWLTWLMLQ
ncbi:MAG: hypothetical protein V4574_13735 [Pseudomonadota bacterium]